jgi:hypothetical protein
MVRKLVLGMTAAGVLVLSGASAAFADTTPNTPGQPGQSCQAQTLSPGNAASAPGSAFNTSGVAGTHYAGNAPQNSTNPNSVSQYDVACFQVSH